MGRASVWNHILMTRIQQQVPGVIGFAPATDAAYLRELQAGAREGSDGLVNSLKLLYATLDTDTFFAHDDAGRAAEAQALILSAARSLRDGGADFLVVTSNTGSIILDDSGDTDLLPRESIFDAAMASAASAGHSKVGLLSTRRTVDSRRYEEAGDRSGVAVITPRDDLVNEISEMIDREAIRDIQTQEGLNLVRSAVAELAAHGAQAVVLGCTDLMLFGPAAIGQDVLPVIDSTAEHARATVRRALSGEHLSDGHVPPSVATAG